MALQITPNQRTAGNLNITANQRARMSSVLAIDWNNVTGKPSLVVGLGSVIGTGIFAVTDLSGGAATRTITGTANEITSTNGDGVLGNPTLSIPSALTFTGKTITGGTYTSVVSINGNFWTAGTGRLTLGAGKTATISNTLTFTGTDGSSVAFGTGGTVAYQGGTLAQFAATTSLQLLGVISDETGTGSLVFASTPTLVTPVLGVATATSINKVAITAPASNAALTLIDGTTLTGPAASGVAMTLGNAETVTGVKTFGSAGAVGRFKLAGTTSGSTVLDATATASGTMTLPAATDTLVGKATTDILTNKTFNSAGTGNVLQVSGVTVSAGQYPGEPTTGSATAGNVGEYVTSDLVAGSGVSLTTNVTVNVTSISLTAGDWDVSAVGGFDGNAATTVTFADTSVSTTTATEDATDGRIVRFFFNNATVFNSVIPTIPLPPTRFSLSGTTTVFLTARAVFATNTAKAFGTIRARRIR